MHNSTNNPLQQKQLEDAFQVFNQVSEQLVDSYHQLQTRVSLLNQELAAARSERMRQLAEKEILANRLSKLLDTLPAAVVVLDAEEQLEQINPAAKALMPGIAIGQSWFELSRRQFQAGQEGHERRLISGKLVNITEKRLDPEAGRIILMLDITEKRELQERLDRQQRLTAMGEMAAQLAHQIRTPLSSALLYTSNLARADLNQNQRERFSERCRQRLHYMERQINDMLAFARGGQYEPESACLSHILEQMVQTLAPLFAEQQAEIVLDDRSQGDAVICGNADALLGAFNNLANNTLDHSGVGVTLRVVLEQTDNLLTLRFEDNGPGVDPAVAKQVFDPFFTTRSDGTGLGLAIVQSVVLGHGGEISVYRPAAGGAGFKMCFATQKGKASNNMEQRNREQQDLKLRGVA
ncbi:MAG: HAMP domain-containing histidine kinase [Chromatiales bacterium]|nr:HAMP domain-containing histidine kinase [Chromatiales bacterium]